jgi:hypothetical protein
MTDDDDEATYQARIRREVARFVRLPVGKVVFLKRYDQLNPPVCGLEVEGKGPYFALDVVLDFDEVQTYVVPLGDKVKTPRDVHRACRNFLIKTGRIVLESD